MGLFKNINSNFGSRFANKLKGVGSWIGNKASTAFKKGKAFVEKHKDTIDKALNIGVNALSNYHPAVNAAVKAVNGLSKKLGWDRIAKITNPIGENSSIKLSQYLPTKFQTAQDEALDKKMRRRVGNFNM